MGNVRESAAGTPDDSRDDTDPEAVARAILLRRLAAAPRTRAELRSDLLKRGTPEPVADRVLDRFTEVGLIDDTEFARLWVASRQRTRGSARSVLRHELRGKGVGDADVSQALEAIDDEQERARALELVIVRMRSLARLEPDVRKRRLVSMLMRRGYRQGVAFSVVAEALAVDPADEFGEADPPI
jgi:regulatory protein